MSDAAHGLDVEEFAAWFRLVHAPGVSRGAARALLATFGTPQGVFRAPASQWRQVVSAKAAQCLAEPADAWQPRLQAALDWLRSGPARSFVTLGDERYPERLLQTADPPLLLFVQGDAQVLRARCLAIVGSRRPTPQGRQAARDFAQALASHGLVIVSGLAHGIDGAAHEGVLAAGGRTVAVVGSGLDQVYPAAHAALAGRIAASGALISEYAPGTPPLAENFPQRNRIIAGLAEGVLVVEAALQSGSLITARLAVEGGREVFAIPGSIHAPQARGCHALIKQGAKLVETAQDVLDELGMAPSPAAPPDGATRAEQDNADPAEDPILQAMGYGPTSLDAVSARTGWSAADLAVRLLEFELQGQVQRLPGGLYQRIRLG